MHLPWLHGESGLAVMMGMQTSPSQKTLFSPSAPPSLSISLSLPCLLLSPPCMPRCSYRGDVHLFHMSSHQGAQFRSENRRLKQAHSKSPTQVGSLFPFPLFPSITFPAHLFNPSSPF